MPGLLIGDVLTFYQERIANEGYLRTATERRSILELAALIGYQLNPGVAANTFLAFQVDDAAGAPTTAIVPKGMRVQSVPGQGALPQPFETSEEITARVEWNALKPRQMRPQELAIRDGKLIMLGLSVGLGADAEAIDASAVHPLDQDLPVPPFGTVEGAEVNTIYVAGTNTAVKTGDVLLLVGKKNQADAQEQTLPRVVRAVEAENALNRTRIEFEGPQLKAPGYGIKLNQLAAAVAPVGRSQLVQCERGGRCHLQRAGARCVRRRTGVGDGVARQLLLPHVHDRRAARRSCRRPRLERSPCVRGSGFSDTTRRP